VTPTEGFSLFNIIQIDILSAIKNAHPLAQAQGYAFETD
jgi:hypothetical protein